MGNAISASTQTYFFTSCMAKYTCITKPQVMAIRNILVSLATVTSDKPKPRNVGSATNSEPLMIRRRHLYQAIQKTNIVKDPDHEVLELLFTMWTNPENEKSKTQAPWYEFMISISLLACKTDSLDQALRFALHVVSRNHSSDMGRMISASDAIAFLNAFCTTASYFGDVNVLQSKQIYKMVDQMYDTISMISSDDLSVQHDMSCDEFVKRLLLQKSVQDIVAFSLKPRNFQWDSNPAVSAKKNDRGDMMNPKANRKDRRLHEKSSWRQMNRKKERSMDARDEENSYEDENSLEDSSMQDDHDDYNSQDDEENMNHALASSPRPALKYTTTRPVASDNLTTLTPNSVPSTDLSSSNVSSVKLTPLARIAISSHNPLDIPNIQNV